MPDNDSQYIKELSLENSDKVAIVDAHNYERLRKFKWYVNPSNHIGRWYTEYAYKQSFVSLASEIMNRPNCKFDHKDRNGFNNLESNFRLATVSQNAINSKSRPHSSIFRGVSFYKRDKNWQVFLRENGNHHFLGRFVSEINAAIAFNMAAMKYQGEFAVLNPVPFTW